MNRRFLLPLLLLLTTTSFAQSWKELANDLSVNYYDVCANAKLYFDTIDKEVKGSGYKGFQRWKRENEFKYYPSGDRGNVDPYFVKNQFEQFQQSSSASRPLFQSGWEELGPTSVGQITGGYGIGMGRIETFYVDPNNTQKLYIGTYAGGFWKSTNGGLTWAGSSTDFLAAAGVNTIAVSPTNPDSVLINVNNSHNLYTHGIYRSIDGGNNWNLSNFNPTNLGWGGLGSNAEIFKIIYHPTIPNLVFIGTNDGLYRSDDNLGTWTIPSTNNSFTDIDFHPTNPNIVYAYAKSTPNTFYKSIDAGLTFTSLAIPGSSGNYTGKVDVSADCPNCVFYLSYVGLWKSIDSGTSFSLVSNTNQYPHGFAVSDVDDTKMIAGVVDAYASTNGGINFSQKTFWYLGYTNGAGNGFQNSYNTSTNYIHADIRDARYINGVYYAVTDGFLVNSADNGNNWNILSEDIGIRMNYNLGVSQSNHDRTICGSQDNGISVNTENGWVEMYGADGLECIIHPLNDNWMIGSIQDGSRRRTLDAGQTIANGGNFSGFNGGMIPPLLYDPNDHMRIYTMGMNLHRSDNFGMNWTTLYTPFFPNPIQHASIAENNSDYIVVTFDEFIHLSADGGTTWTNIQGTLPSYAITDVVFDPNDDNTIIVTYARHQIDNSKVFITHDLGASWQNITYNLGSMPVRCAVIDHTDSSTIYLGTEIGVYKKSMSGSNWSLYNPDLPNTSISEMEIMWGSNTLRASTWGRGLWEYSIDGRNDFPAITKTQITSRPTELSPKETIDQYVSSTILYDNTVTSAYVEWSVNSPTFGNVIPMTNTSGNNWVSNTPLPDSSAGTKMYFKVFAVGTNGDTTETYKFMYTIKPYEFCNAIGTNNGTNLHISNVSVANVDNTTANDSYTYYVNDLVSLLSGSTYSITLTGSSNAATTDYGAWIDFNKDAVFDQNEEILFQIDTGSPIAGASFVVPTSAILGDTLILRTRIGSYVYNGIDPCGSALGEVEDYPVLISCGPLSTIDIQVACDSFTWVNGITYTSSNSTAIDTMQSMAGCDSVVTLNLTVNVSPVAIGTAIISACDSFTWINGITYLASTNVPTWTLLNSTGCDSVVNLDLTIHNTSASNILNLIDCEAVISPSGNYLWNSSGLYFDTLQSVNGCDSILQVNFTLDSIDRNVLQLNNTLVSVQTNASYQWINCADNSIIQGETSQTFVPTLSGNFAVIIHYNNCTDTSFCASSTVGLNNVFTLENFKIYPNPTSGSFEIELSKEYETVRLEILNSLGQIISNENYKKTSKINSAIQEAAGLYFVRILIDGGSAVIPLVKN